MTAVYVGTQPIYNAQSEVYGHELLFRDSKQNLARVHDNMAATSKVLYNLLHGFGISRRIHEGLLFINVDEQFLNSATCTMIPPDQAVLELLESCRITEGLVDRIRELCAKGYRFALDDFDLSEAHFEQFREILPFMDIVKVDLLQVRDFGTIKARLKRLEVYDVQLLAEKIDNIDFYSYCKYLGFAYFQGYYLEKPSVHNLDSINGDRQLCIGLINRIFQDDSPEKIADTLKENPRMSANFLKYLHTPFFNFKQNVSSIRHGVRLLGMNRMLGWLTLCLYGTGEDPVLGDRFTRLAQRRSDMMRECAHLHGFSEEEAETAHLVGLVSLLDHVLRMDFCDIFREISFCEKIAGSVLNKNGSFGLMLRAIHIAERGKSSRLNFLFNRIPVENEHITHRIRHYLPVN